MRIQKFLKEPMAPKPNYSSCTRVNFKKNYETMLSKEEILRILLKFHRRKSKVIKVFQKTQHLSPKNLLEKRNFR